MQCCYTDGDLYQCSHRHSFIRGQCGWNADTVREGCGSGDKHYWAAITGLFVVIRYQQTALPTNQHCECMTHTVLRNFHLRSAGLSAPLQHNSCWRWLAELRHMPCLALLEADCTYRMMMCSQWPQFGLCTSVLSDIDASACKMITDQRVRCIMRSFTA